MRCLVCLLILFYLVACKRDERYFPMRKGDEKTYEIISSKSGQLTRKRTLTVYVLNKVEQSGKDYWRIRNVFIGERDQEGKRSLEVVTLLYRLDEGGVYGVVEQSPASVELQIVKFPLKLGASWEVPMGGKRNLFSVVGFEDVTIDNTTYKRCLHLHSETKDGDIL